MAKSVAGHWIVLLGAGATLLGGCAAPPPSALEPADKGGSQRVAEAALAPIPVPDLGGMEEAVRAQLESQAGALEAQRRAGASAETLAAAYDLTARLYHAYDLLDAAEVCYHNAEVLAGRSAERSYLLGFLYQSRGDLELAAEHLAEVLAAQPNDGAALVRLAQVRMQQGWAAEAKPLFERALKTPGSRAAAHHGLGRLALEAGDDTAALRHLRAALEEQPQAGEVRYLLAQAYRRLGNLGAAREALEGVSPGRVTFADPRVAELARVSTGLSFVLNRAHVAFNEERFAEAAEDYRKAVKIAPQDVETRRFLATALERSGQREAAIEELRAAVEIAPHDAALRFQLARTLVREGDDAEALGHYRRAAELDPTDLVTRFNLANTLARTGRLKEAAAAYREVLEQEPQDTTARLYLSRVLLLDRQEGAALKNLEAGLALTPDDLGLRHLLARTLASASDRELRRGRRALELAEGVFEQEPSLEHGVTLAMAHAAAGDFAAAVYWQKQAVAGAEAQGESGLSQTLRQDLARYESGQACCAPEGG